MKVGPLTLRSPASAVDATAGRGYMDWPGEPQRFWEIYLAQSWALDLGVSEILIRDQSLRSYTAINPSYSCNCFLWKHVETALKKSKYKIWDNWVEFWDWGRGWLYPHGNATNLLSHFLNVSTSVVCYSSHKIGLARPSATIPTNMGLYM